MPPVLPVVNTFIMYVNKILFNCYMLIEFIDFTNHTIFCVNESKKNKNPNQ